ncbi:type I 3-dehydroquinate dehydratase [Leptospira interrogans]|uniref:type I 3-dehydroquinate dehydratase n=1 Tax=Leptospira interrogans TaxID=173 RepID=UPI00122CA543|nr:type I 3-dehydroquinate dehydratase [Leptospira interrogans]KAA1268628.1 type I 3-dehydroquinate dehydratase [Leptospira interrogans serovar Weerasinghe]ULG81440.1 type I 3-dehydroquinate dehydratase [Leptospira interrogans]UML69059.1 type I 3-dehydroquinate dehydratase [Leptospira interrogans]UML72386.1 type I 3-dehydroquinate dehydratase [Leptospira interrogans]UMQ58524.1 type I 3-dehydroquinate dehydratase [Leptospira interrogans]
MNQREFKIVLTINEDEFFSLKKHPFCDRIEIRLDLFSPKNIGQNLVDKIEELNAKCIFTYRQPEDTDQVVFAKKEELDFYKIISKIDPKVHYLDLELNRPNDLFESNLDKGFGLVRSVHKFDGILSEQEIRDWIDKDFYLKSEKYKSILPLIYKFAVFPNSIHELTKFLSSFRIVSNEFRKLNILLTGICMGPLGIVSRVFPDSFGSIFTYCCLNNPKAPGQVDLESLIQLRNL